MLADQKTINENNEITEEGFSPMVLMGQTYYEKKSAGTELLEICHDSLATGAISIGHYRGLKLELAFDSFAQEYRLSMLGKLRHTVNLGTDVFGNIQRMENALDTLPIKAQSCKERLEELEKAA